MRMVKNLKQIFFPSALMGIKSHKLLFVATILIICIVPIVFFSKIRMNNQIRIKGIDNITLYINSKEQSGEQEIIACSGDTISFSYRLRRPKYIEICYRDNGGPLQYYTPHKSSPTIWDKTGSYKKSTLAFILDDHWSREQIWVIASEKEIERQQINKYIKADKKKKGMFIKKYTLLNCKYQ